MSDRTNKARLVSVIIPIYNVAKYLPKCVDSVLAQTYQNLEIILIDDGSTDGSGKICDEYAAKDNRIRVIHQPNSGVSAARNAGLDVAGGEYIGFVDPDDYIHPKMYQTLLECIENSRADIAMCDFFRVSEDGRITASDFLHKTDYLYADYQEWIQDLSGCGKGVYGAAGYQVIWNKLFKKSKIGTVRFDPNFIRSQDVNFILDICVSPLKIQFCSQALYYYVQRSNSTMTQKKIPQFRCAYIIWKRIYNLLEENNLKSVSLQLLQKHIIPSACKLAILIILWDDAHQYQPLLTELKQVLKQQPLSKINSKKNYVLYIWIYFLRQHFNVTVKLLRLPGIKQIARWYISHG